MSELQVLVATMQQNDFSKIKEMNIQTDVLFANQADEFRFETITFDSHEANMMTTKTRGLSKNRNIAIEFANPHSKFIMFADDDMVLVDGYEKIINDVFDKHPEAQAIKFNLQDISTTRTLSMKRIESFHRATRRNMTSSGVCGLVIRTKYIHNELIHFNESFGAGTERYCGEDTIFYQRLLNARFQVFLSPEVVAGIDESESCWFKGYNAQYFYTVGMVFATIYPHLAKLLAIRSSYKFSKRKTEMRFREIVKCYWNGIDDCIMNENPNRGNKNDERD